MSLETSLYLHLSTHVDIQPLVGNRVYPVLLPQNPTYPAITYRRDDDSRYSTLDGNQNAFVDASLILDAWGETYAAAKNLADEIKAALQNLTGDMSGLTVNRVHMGGYVEVYETEVQAYRVSHGIFVSYSEA
jgi:hypothetical protein